MPFPSHSIRSHLQKIPKRIRSSNTSLPKSWIKTFILAPKSIDCSVYQGKTKDHRLSITLLRSNLRLCMIYVISPISTSFTRFQYSKLMNSKKMELTTLGTSSSPLLLDFHLRICLSWIHTCKWVGRLWGPLSIPRTHAHFGVLCLAAIVSY